MKAIKLLAVLLLVGIFTSCEDNSEDCQLECADVMAVEGLNRTYTGTKWQYTYKLTMKSQCSGDIFYYKTRPYNNQKDVYELGQICDKDFSKYN